jgi:hypothetical protein
MAQYVVRLAMQARKSGVQSGDVTGLTNTAATVRFERTNRGMGSAADLHELNLDAVDLPVELACHTAEDRCVMSGRR